MGKTESGAIWLDESKTSVYDFYQYWINTDDRDVERFLKYFTTLSLEQIADLCGSGGDIRKAKEVLAFEVTKLAHGAEKAVKAEEASKSLFGGSAGSLDAMPTIEIEESVLRSGISVIDLFCLTELTSTKSAAVRLIDQGGAYINDVKIGSTKDVIDKGSLTKDGLLILRKGKKTFYRITIRKGK